MTRLIIAAMLLALVPGCATSPANIARTGDWRSIATASDTKRLREWRASFAKGLARARAAGHSAAIAREGRLLDPDAAIPGALPNGRYRCRIIKLGAKSDGLLDYIAYSGFLCRVRAERDVQGFAKLSGSQRQVGLILPGDSLRGVFLGTLVLGDEVRAMQYGRDPERDVAGWVEAIEPNRWRIVLPAPSFESLVDVVELIPQR